MSSYNMTHTEKMKELLKICIKSIHNLSWHYFYCISREESVSDTLYSLLSVKEADLIKIFKVCGFYNIKIGAFQMTAFKTWVTVNFKREKGEVTSFWREDLLKIGLGEQHS